MTRQTSILRYRLDGGGTYGLVGVDAGKPAVTEPVELTPDLTRLC